MSMKNFIKYKDTLNLFADCSASFVEILSHFSRWLLRLCVTQHKTITACANCNEDFLFKLNQVLELKQETYRYYYRYY